jgi:hypothetical protein
VQTETVSVRKGLHGSAASSDAGQCDWGNKSSNPLVNSSIAMGNEFARIVKKTGYSTKPNGLLSPKK